MFCQQCGTQLPDESNFCPKCGRAIQSAPTTSGKAADSATLSAAQTDLLHKLSNRLKTNGIIWIILGCIQVLLVFAGAWTVCIIGIVNIIYATSEFRLAKKIKTNPPKIVSSFKPLVGPIITLVYNLTIGGIIGILGSIYYLIFVRGFVMGNKNQFLAMESFPANNNCQATTTPQQLPPNITITVALTEDEAKNGITKEVAIDGLEKPMKIHFPKKLKDNSFLNIQGLNLVNESGETIKTDVLVRISIIK